MRRPALRGRQIGRQLVLVSLIALAVAGCGRRGTLEPPPGLAAPTATGDEKPVAGGSDVALTPSKPHTPPPIQPGTQPFILDPLL
jgi:predicted small lipoprotein YifL